MGTIRLLLALAVLFGHAAGFGIIPAYSPQGIYFPPDPTIAVEMFFVVSGFLMGLILTESFRKQDGWVRRFYIDRYFFRLMPAYLVVLTVVTWINPILFHLPLDFAGTLLRFSAVSLIGIDLTAFYQVGGAAASVQIPLNQAWSLGLEIAFYLMVPFLITMRIRTLIVLAIVLLAARLAITDAPLMIQQRLFPLQFYFFLLGMLSFRLYKVLPRNASLGFAAMAVMIVISASGGFVGFAQWNLAQWNPINSLYCTAALALLMPAIFRLTKDWKRDRLLGDLSYPVYLVHVDCGSYVPHARDSLWGFMAISIGVSLVMLLLIEIPMAWVRHSRALGKIPPFNGERPVDALRPTSQSIVGDAAFEHPKEAARISGV